jgi:putative spermidine/putrescine transport system substrate-binding protein
MHRPRRKIRSGPGRFAAVVAVAGLTLAACGGDDDSSDTTAAAETTAGAETTAAPETTAVEATEAPATTATEATEAPATTAMSGGAGFASMDDVAALCTADPEKPDKIVFTTFPGQKDALDAALEPWTTATGVDVEWLENGLGDRLTKMAAEKGSPTIDVALVPVGEVAALLDNGVVDPADAELPNYEQLIDAAKLEGGYGVSTLQFGIAYNPAFVTTAPTSWADLLDPTYAGHIALPAMPNSGGYAFLTMLAHLEGGDESDLSGAIEQVAAFKGSVHSFIGSSVSVEEQIKSGEIQMYVDIGGVAVRGAKERGVPVEFVVPEEGAPISMNVLVVPAGNDHVGCAESFVAFMLGQEGQQAWAEKFYYGTVSSATVLDPALEAELYPAPGATDIVPLDWAVTGANSADTLDLWNREVTS